MYRHSRPTVIHERKELKNSKVFISSASMLARYAVVRPEVLTAGANVESRSRQRKNVGDGLAKSKSQSLQSLDCASISSFVVA
jgi:hypothetical protein